MVLRWIITLALVIANVESFSSRFASFSPLQPQQRYRRKLRPTESVSYPIQDYGCSYGHVTGTTYSSYTCLQMTAFDEDQAAVEEEARLKILDARRKQIRNTLKAAESLRNYRLQNELTPELDEDGKPIKSDSKSAVALTAFVVAAGAIALRIGGRAALISAVGLDFMNENPGLKENLDRILDTAASLDPLTEAGLFLAAWTAVKVFCFDAGGVALALSSGILFGGVLQGGLFSAFCAAVGSSIAFSLAKLDTPVRTKALEIVDEYPSLRGIERVVAEDGFKAILTLRLAPILPIPLGMYNYIYAVTGVPFFDFFAGIFLGSIKPYLLDSYLGYFGKQIVDGSAAEATGLQDVILLVALGLSVLIGVFASQLAGETFDSVMAEVEAEKKEKAGEEEEVDDGIIRSFLNFDLPQWLIGFQVALAMADDRVHQMIYDEYDAKLWNYTKTEPIPRELDPALDPTSPEIAGAKHGFDFGEAFCDALVLSPALAQTFLIYADPLLDEEQEKADRNVPRDFDIDPVVQEVANVVVSSSLSSSSSSSSGMQELEATLIEDDDSEEALLKRLSALRSITRERLNKLNAKIRDEEEIF